MRRVLLPLALLIGCSTSEPMPQHDLTEEVALGRSLDGTDALEMWTESTEELVVHYRDESGGPIVGIQVDFVLMTGAPGASLWPSRAYTDAQGEARTQLRSGSTATSLRVRASALDAAPFFVDVVVRQAAVAAISAGVSYDGKRPVQDFALAALEGKRCPEAVALGASDVIQTVATRDAVTGFRLEAGSSAALVAWALDVTGAPVARGCVEVAVPEGDENARMSVVVPLADLPLALSDSLALPLALDVSASVARIDEAVRTAVGAQLAASAAASASAEADYYLAALAREVATTESAASSALAAARASVASTITTALSKARTGPRAFAALLGELLTKRGAKLAIEASYRGATSVVLDELTAVSSDGTLASALSAAPVFALRSARFEEARAALELDGLELKLGLGEYGRVLVAALGKGDASDRLRAAAGCVDALAPALSGTCTPQAITRACERALTDLTSAIDGALATLDASAPTIALAGSLSVHDRSDDGVADDLGAGTLQGTWGRDAVTVEVDRPGHVLLQN